MANVIPIKSTTQIFTEVEDIDHDIVLFTDGSCALVITTTAVNFGLLSDNEQAALIHSYAGLLNSLSFPIQILVRTQHKDVTAYLKLLEEQEKKQTNPKLATSIRSYRNFVATMVKEKNVLDKKFYIIIPFSSLELGKSPKVLLGQKKSGLPYKKDYVFERALAILLPKRDHVIRLLQRFGLRGTQLTNDQLIHLMFSIYNPKSPVPSLENTNKSSSAHLSSGDMLINEAQKEEIEKHENTVPQNTDTGKDAQKAPSQNPNNNQTKHL